MSISFNEIPNNLRAPIFAVEIDNSRANQGPSVQEYVVLMIGQKLSGGSKPALQLDQIQSTSQAKDFYGAGSMLAHMIEKYRQNNTVNQMFAIALDDNGSGVAATGKISFTGPSTAAGTLNLYLGGRLVQVGVASGDSADDMATAMAAAIQANSDLAVSAAVNGSNANEVDLTAKNAGESMNEFDVRFNHFSGEELPAGVGVTITAMAGGTANPDIDTALAILDDSQYSVIVHAYTDASNLGKIESDLDAKFGPLKQIPGIAFSGKRGDLSSLSSFGNTRNSKLSSIMGVQGPTSPWEWASAIGGIVALNGQIDPARPFQTLEIDGVLQPQASELLIYEERNNLLKNGISAYRAAPGGVVVIDRLITTFQTDSFGNPDASFLDVNTLLTLDYLRFDLRVTFQQKFPRHKLASDAARVAPGQPILTPKAARAEVVSIFRGWEELGLVENIDQFKNDLLVQRNVQDPNRLDIRLSPDLINQFRVGAAQIQYLL